jgi:alpha-L-rhamnosidase
MLKTILLNIASLYLFVVSAVASMQPTQLTCEYQSNPLGIDVIRPRLSWTFTSEGRNQRQTAYELLLSDQLPLLLTGKGNVWTTGKVNSRQPLHIPYGGAPLKPFTRYYWQVRVYNAEGKASDWSEPAWFETAMLQTCDWQARWIGDGRAQFVKDEDFYADDPMPLFRREFAVEKVITSARLYISGLGYAGQGCHYALGNLAVSGKCPFPKPPDVWLDRRMVLPFPAGHHSRCTGF